MTRLGPHRFAIVAAAWLAACVQAETPATEEQDGSSDPLACGVNCEPYSTQECVTTDGRQSVRVCIPSGMAYYTCGTGGEVRTSSCPAGTKCAYHADGGMRCQGAAGTGGSAGTAGTAGAAGKPAGAAGGANVPAEGAPCVNSGVLACPTISEKTALLAGYSLRCSGGEWVFHEACDAGQFCYPWPGPDSGRCLPLQEECVGKKAGEEVCLSEKVLGKCKNLLSIESQKTCQFGCYNDRCGECTDGSKQQCPSNVGKTCIKGKWIKSCF